MFNADAELGYIKGDGSLDDGMELVTHPCTLDYHIHRVPWAEVTALFRGLGYRSHQCRTCGLHVHVNRNALGVTEHEQELAIANILYIFERFWQELLRFSRRTESQVNQWAARYGYKNTGKEILETAKKACSGRYSCVNLTNANTIEFRIFRGTLKTHTILATLQLINELCNVAVCLSEEEVHALSWADFMLHMDAEKYPQLVRYLKERRLYINEPVAAEGEV